VDLDEAGLLVVGDRAIHVVHRDGEGLHRDVLPVGFAPSAAAACAATSPAVPAPTTTRL
jgi:hypothetical protein